MLWTSDLEYYKDRGIHLPPEHGGEPLEPVKSPDKFPEEPGLNDSLLLHCTEAVEIEYNVQKEVSSSNIENEAEITVPPKKAKKEVNYNGNLLKDTVSPAFRTRSRVLGVQANQAGTTAGTTHVPETPKSSTTTRNFNWRRSSRRNTPDPPLEPVVQNAKPSTSIRPRATTPRTKGVLKKVKPKQIDFQALRWAEDSDDEMLCEIVMPSDGESRSAVGGGNLPVNMNT